MNMSRFSYSALVLIAIAAGVLAYLFGGKLIVGNKDAMDVIVNLFSILAGFIVAIMTLLGDDTLRPGWRAKRIDADQVKRRLDRQQLLFWLYLATLTLIIGGRLIDSVKPEWSEQLQRIAFGMAVASLILSYALPVALRGAQIARLEAAVKNERDAAPELERH